ncbi:MAG: hypothetical protein AAB573_00895 [Patescibacteria group bacterium]
MEFRLRYLLVPVALVTGVVGGAMLANKEPCRRTAHLDLADINGRGKKDFCNAIPYMERDYGRQLTPDECESAVQSQSSFLRKQKRCD